MKKARRPRNGQKVKSKAALPGSLGEVLDNAGFTPLGHRIVLGGPKRGDENHHRPPYRSSRRPEVASSDRAPLRGPRRSSSSLRTICLATRPSRGTTFLSPPTRSVAKRWQHSDRQRRYLAVQHRSRNRKYLMSFHAGMTWRPRSFGSPPRATFSVTVISQARESSPISGGAIGRTSVPRTAADRLTSHRRRSTLFEVWGSSSTGGGPRLRNRSSGVMIRRNGRWISLGTSVSSPHVVPRWRAFPLILSPRSKRSRW